MPENDQGQLPLNDPQKKQVTPGQKGAGVAALLIAAVAIASPLAEKWEGYAKRVYKDPAGIPTWCFGETEQLKKDPSYIYSKTECMALLRQRMQKDYAPRILACLPELKDERRPEAERVRIFGALIDASYNAGYAAVCRSPMAAKIHAYKFDEACDPLPYWYITAQKRVNGKRVGQPFVLRGLQNRRKDEYKVCVTGSLY